MVQDQADQLLGMKLLCFNKFGAQDKKWLPLIRNSMQLYSGLS